MTYETIQGLDRSNRCALFGMPSPSITCVHPQRKEEAVSPLLWSVNTNPSNPLHCSMKTIDNHPVHKPYQKK